LICSTRKPHAIVWRPSPRLEALVGDLLPGAGRVSSGDRLPLGLPGKLEAEFAATLDAVAAAPPPRLAGGGKWEAMHGTMSSWHEIRLTGPGREQFRLFCLPENGTPAELARRGLQRPAIAAITGMRKPWRTTFSDRDYQRVGILGEAHQRNYPRAIAI
jgi:hypothetical protein